MIVFVKAVILSSVASVLVVLFAFRFEGFSRPAFILDGILIVHVSGRKPDGISIVPATVAERKNQWSRRRFIYGAGDGR